MTIPPSNPAPASLHSSPISWSIKRLVVASALFSTAITVFLGVIGYPHWSLYGIGSLYGLVWLASYGLQNAPFVKAFNAGPALAFSLSPLRVLGFAALACWTGDFSVEKTTVVLIGCFSYKCVIVAYGAISCGLVLRHSKRNSRSLTSP